MDNFLLQVQAQLAGMVQVFPELVIKGDSALGGVEGLKSSELKCSLCPRDVGFKHCRINSFLHSKMQCRLSKVPWHACKAKTGQESINFRLSVH